MIKTFRGQYDFLSNFYNAPIMWDGRMYLNNEAAFQSAKTLSKEARDAFSSLDPATAKKKGRRVSLRPDWEEVKIRVMYEVVKAKFTQHPELGEKLLATRGEYLQEGNTWNDRTWGVCKGAGLNYLGKILMRVRLELWTEQE